MLHSGNLRQRITFQSETSSSDGAGGYTLGWSDVMNVWADITPVSGREIFAFSHLEGRVTHTITLRYQSGLTAAMRVLYGDRIFNIRAVLNRDESNRWLELLVEEGAPT